MCVGVFIPNCKTNDVAELQNIGCDNLFDRRHGAIFADCFDGPQGQAGKLVYAGMGNSAVSMYAPARQTWLDCGDYQLGFWNHLRPTPEMLQKDVLIDGEQVILCDDSAWTVPIPNYFPKRLTIDRTTGEETYATAPQYASYIARCNELLMLFISDKFQQRVESEHVVHIPGGLTFAAEALAQNYRVNRDLVDLLGLIDEHKAFDIAWVSSGCSLAEKLGNQKKTELSAAGTS